MFRALRLNFHFSAKPYNSAKNYYKILNISETASQTDIKKAFRDLVKKYHPDSAKGKQDLFKEVNEAYQILSDDSVKKEYDQFRSANSPQKHRNSYNDTSQQTYSTQGSYREQQRQYRGYQPAQEWNNQGFREHFMHDLYHQQQNQQMRSHFQHRQRAEIQKLLKQRVKESINDNIYEKIRHYNQQAKSRRAKERQEYQAEEKIREEEELKRYRKKRNEIFSNSSEKMRQQLYRVAEGIATNVKDGLKAAQELKNWWLKFKENSKK